MVTFLSCTEIQSFSELRNGNYLYVDKTEQICRLLRQGKYFFLSRPRRFGKSLLLSTIKEIYQGHRALFDGLWIADQWDWGKTNPVIHLSFASTGYRELGLEMAIRLQLQTLAAEHDITLPETAGISRQFADLMEKLAKQHGKVVILIDEYDKPLIDYLDDIPLAKANQQVMKSFYSVLKDSDPYIEFLLITGVSKFSRVSLFSDLNNLYDLTLDYDNATLLGYTQTELEQVFAPYMPMVEQRLKIDRAELLVQLRQWYNGYRWDLDHSVYNPFSILSFFQAKKCKPPCRCI